MLIRALILLLSPIISYSKIFVGPGYHHLTGQLVESKEGIQYLILNQGLRSQTYLKLENREKNKELKDQFINLCLKVESNKIKIIKSSPLQTNQVKAVYLKGQMGCPTENICNQEPYEKKKNQISSKLYLDESKDTRCPKS